MDYSTLKIRCSAIGEIMTGTSKGWNVEKSTTCQSYLTKMYREERYNRKQQFESKYLTKGIKGEQDAITLLARVKKIMFKKNTERLYNDYLTGEPDTIVVNDEGYDLKCSWSLWTFPEADDELKQEYYYQNMGYMALTGAKKWSTVYCLVNAPANLIINEKQKLWYALDCPDDSNTSYIEKCIEIEKNMIFDMAQFIKENPSFNFDCKEWVYDIPMDERVIMFPVERDEAIIASIYNRIDDCRQFMQNKYGVKQTA